MLGIFGGSFDPPHFGHIKSALTLLELFDFEQIRFVPCQLSPHKNEVHASSQHRLKMLGLVCDSHNKLVVDDCELKREAPSYTIDTLVEFREKFGKKKSLVLILGMDAYLSFCKWHRYEEILSYCHLMLLQRPGYTLPKSGCEKDFIEEYLVKDINLLVNNTNGKIYLSEIEKIDLSSTAVRNTISDEEQPRYSIPGNIWNYIKRNNLYR